jgi:hypothetical protein
VTLCGTVFAFVSFSKRKGANMVQSKKPGSSSKNNDGEIREEELPVSRKMLRLVRDELKSEIRSECSGVKQETHEGFGRFRSDFSDFKTDLSVRTDAFEQKFLSRFDQNDKAHAEFDKRFEQIDKRFDQNDKAHAEFNKRFDQIDKRFDQMQVQIEGLQTSVSKIEADVFHMKLMLEEQRADNRIVFDALLSQIQTNKRFESEIKRVDGMVRSIAKGAKLE